MRRRLDLSTPAHLTAATLALGTGLMAGMAGLTASPANAQPPPSPPTELIDPARVSEAMGGREVDFSGQRVPFLGERQRLSVDLLGARAGQPRSPVPQAFMELNRDAYAAPNQRPEVIGGFQLKWRF